MKLERALVTKAIAANIEAVFWSGMPSNLAAFSVGEPAADDEGAAFLDCSASASAAAADSAASDNRNRLLLLLLLLLVDEDDEDLRLELHTERSVGDGEADRTKLTLVDSIICLELFENSIIKTTNHFFV